MAQIMNIPEINEVKEILVKLQNEEIVKYWELPYEGLITRLSAAIFFVSGTDKAEINNAWKELGGISGFSVRENKEKTLSKLEWRVEFNNNGNAN